MVHEFQSIAKKLLADFERSASVKHPGIKGTARERALVANLFRDHLPSKYSIGSGLIVDREGNVSAQQDIVLYDALNVPVLQDYQENKIFFAEQVYSTIEVKSTLGRREIKDIIQKAESINKLSRKSAAKGQGMLVFGIAFSSTLSIDQVRDYVQRRINQSGKGWGIGAVALLRDKYDKTGLVANIDDYYSGTIKLSSGPRDPVAGIWTKSQGETLLVFYLLLMEAIRLAAKEAVLPNYLEYATAAGLGTIDVLIGKPGLDLLANKKDLDILRNAHQASDDELIKAWVNLIQHTETAINEVIIGKEAVFLLGGVLVEGPGAHEIMESSQKYLEGRSNDSDKDNIAFLVRLLRRVPLEDTYLEIGNPPNSS